MGRGSARECSIVLILLVAASLASAEQIYDVGDNAGWTVGVNYSTWVSSKTFHTGDTIVFVYDKLYHNVLEVSRADYHSCNSASPIAKHETGKDSVVLSSYDGHRFFICGFLGHCAAGQKLDIRIPKIASAAPPAAAAHSEGLIPAPSTSAAASSAPGSAPHGDNGAARIGGFGACVAATVAVAASALFLL